MELKINIHGSQMIGSRLGHWRALAIGIFAAGLAALIIVAALQPSAADRAAVRERLGVTVAPVDHGQIDGFVRQQAALRERLGVTVAPVDHGQIDALAQEQAALRQRLGVTVAPVDPAEIARLVREQTTPAK